MNSFSVILLDGRGTVRFEGVNQFIGADSEGGFGILAGHSHCVAVLRYGLARFRVAPGVWHYLALPGGVLRFADNQLCVTTVRYFVSEDREAICERLAADMAKSDSDIHSARATLSEIERSLVRRLAELSSPGSRGG